MKIAAMQSPYLIFICGSVTPGLENVGLRLQP